MEESLIKFRIETVRGNLDGVKAALHQGVSVDQPFKKCEWNALMHASSLGHHEIVHYLLGVGADPNFHKELFTPLMAACASNNDNEEKLLKCVQHLTLYSADVNAMERHRLTPLMFACKQGHTNIVVHLVGKQADLNTQDSQGWTALFWAVTKGKQKIVEILLNAGADKEERDRSGGTALLLATRKGFLEIARILRFGIVKQIQDQDIECNTSEEDVSSYSDDRNRMYQICDRNNESSPNSLTFNNEDITNMNLKYPTFCRETTELIRELKRKPWKKSDKEENNTLTYVTAVKILAEFASEISNMHATMAFIRYKFQNFPLATPQDNRWTTTCQLRSITRLTYCKSEQLFMETKYFNEYLNKLDDSEIVPSEIMVEKNILPPDVNTRSGMLTSVIVITACLVVMLWNTKTIRWT